VPPGPRPRDENSAGGAVPDSWTIGGKTLARQRFGRPRGVDGCGRLPRPAKTATSPVAAVFESPRILARAWFGRRVGSGVGSPKRPQELGRRFLVVEQQVGDERIGLAFPAEGRGLAMAGHELDVVAQRP